MAAGARAPARIRRLMETQETAASETFTRPQTPRPTLAPVATGAPDLRRRVKSVLGWLAYRSGLYRRFWRDRALIVFFHRVDDRYPNDQNTTTRAEFRAYCDFFARHFVVVSLGELLERLRAGADVSRHVVITFDDGYRDNLRNAAPELRQRGLPACFFVTSGFVDGTAAAWWDEEKGIVPEWMTWDEVRDLARQHFEIGVHTASHPDLGQLAGTAADAEIAGARARIEAMVRTPAPHFCVPFGGAAHLSPENHERVRRAGFASCLWTIAERVRPGTDPFRLGRVGVSPWFVSPWHFGLDAMRLG